MEVTTRQQYVTTKTNVKPLARTAQSAATTLTAKQTTALCITTFLSKKTVHKKERNPLLEKNCTNSDSNLLLFLEVTNMCIVFNRTQNNSDNTKQTSFTRLKEKSEDNFCYHCTTSPTGGNNTQMNCVETSLYRP